MPIQTVKVAHLVIETYDVEASDQETARDRVERGDVQPMNTEYAESHYLDPELGESVALLLP